MHTEILAHNIYTLAPLDNMCPLVFVDKSNHIYHTTHTCIILYEPSNNSLCSFLSAFFCAFSSCSIALFNSHCSLSSPERQHGGRDMSPITTHANHYTINCLSLVHSHNKHENCFKRNPTPYNATWRAKMQLSLINGYVVTRIVFH